MLDKKNLARLGSEFLGVFILSSAVLSALNREGDLPLIAGTAGLTLALMVLVIGPISGSHINPAVTAGLWSIKKIKSSEAALYITAQLLGGLAAWKVAEYFLNDKLTSLVAAQEVDARIFLAEAVGTLVFTFGIAAAVARKYAGGVQAAAIGGSLFLGIMVAALASNGILNPAVAIGVQSWSWTYALAPLLGGIAGMNLYAYAFADKKFRK